MQKRERTPVPAVQPALPLAEVVARFGENPGEPLPLPKIGEPEIDVSSEAGKNPVPRFNDDFVELDARHGSARNPLVTYASDLRASLAKTGERTLKCQTDTPPADPKSKGCTLGSELSAELRPVDLFPRFGENPLPSPAPLPSLTSALSRRVALFGAVSATGFLAAAGASAVAKGEVVTTPPSTLDPTDAVLIDFAGRTVALARRQECVANQRADAEAVIDRWSFANRPAVPEAPKVPSRMVATDLSTATHRIMQFSEPLDDGDAQAEADLFAFKEARNAHKRAVADMTAQSQVPYLTKLSDRMWNRLIRAIERLTDMQPSTLAGLAAKALVIETLAESDNDLADWWGQNLLRSVAEDAIRLHASSVPA